MAPNPDDRALLALKHDLICGLSRSHSVFRDASGKHHIGADGDVRKRRRHTLGDVTENHRENADDKQARSTDAAYILI
jgi:hypothetical protein